MAPKTVAGLLSEQPEEVLIQMYQSIQTEIQRLEIESRLVEEALSKRTRKRSAPRVPGQPGRQSGVKRGDVRAIVASVGHPTSPAQVRDALRLQGHNISGAAVRNHLRRLVTDGDLLTDGEGHYTAAVRNGDQGYESGSPLFTDTQTQSENPV